jgi:hypothetical protein
MVAEVSISKILKEINLFCQQPKPLFEQGKGR